ncbi:aminodeoxychorismate synthase component I [Streptomyces pseudovenezuelae]|uniref:aminodeoxychorismate synthase component I n=1 Tax=Streptomyces pseudovenezuelae TaxID=67350 RepID=UPI002E368FF1|nr:aminodeoxychorismate synthase component I [Streptomyces pseudovenezuelae]
MRTLLIDNYDSYTYNLFQLLAQTYGCEPTVVANDDPDFDRLDLDSFDAAVISPGPGHPSEQRDFGHSRSLLHRTDLPVLGVCLGHQGIGLLAGAQVVGAPEPRHGHLTTVEHTGRDVFAGLPDHFTAVRYHSLCVAEPLPPQLEVIARAEDGVIMGLRHRELPRWGVQFHPESISTEYGAELVANFRRLALSARPARSGPPAQAPRPTAPARPAAAPPNPPSAPALHAHVRCLERAVDAEAAFTALHGTSSRAFWLDSAHVEPGLSRFSFLGDADGPGGEVLTYRVGDPSVIVEPPGGIPYLESGSIFDVLADRLDRRVTGTEDLPFDLTGGYVGYFGYELKADTGASNLHRAPTPDAMWLRAHRFLAVDHLEDRTYLVGLAEPEDAADTRQWLDRTSAVLGTLPDAPAARALPAPADTDVTRWLARPREQYLADIAASQRQLHAGESYEICLTNSLHLPAPDDDLAYYRRLRRLNPAPYAALLRLGELSVFCSSPERFLRIDRDRTVESKPIKGTTRRSPDPAVDEALRASLQDDPKTRAENLMIVDLLRNDLGRICTVGSVGVPAFMATESYTTVHQLVSTVRGTLRPEASAVDCVRACFPGGSMTGAPKLRTMEIIDSLEDQARGIYSGALGFLGYSGTADLNIVIRTAVRWRERLSVGAGGAIVLDSQPLAEYDEMLVKAEATLRALPLPAADAPRPVAPASRSLGDRIG